LYFEWFESFQYFLAKFTIKIHLETLKHKLFLTFLTKYFRNKITHGSISPFSSSEHLKDKQQNGTSNKQIPTITVKPSLPKSKTQISSVYTKLSSIKPTNLNANANSRSSSIPNYINSKTVKTTQIGSTQLSPSKLPSANAARSPVKSPKRIPQLVKPSIVNGANKISSKSLLSFLPKSDDSNGNSATSSMSTSSSNSSLNVSSSPVSPVRKFV
jgi:hypothetical protein